MPATTQELLDAEAANAAEIGSLVDRGMLDELVTGDLNDDGWSVAALIVHIAHRQDAGAHAIGGRLGVYAGSDDDVDDVNAELIAAARDLSWEQAHGMWTAARARARAALAAVDEVAPVAATWFTEEGIDHMAEHLIDLRRWAADGRGARS